MPTKVDKKRIPQDFDRRRKLTDANKENIKHLYKTGMTVRSIAREYTDVCSRRTIQFILFPERAKHNAELYKLRRKDGRYYNREKHTEAIRNTRKYKRKIFNLLKP